MYKYTFKIIFKKDLTFANKHDIIHDMVFLMFD